MSAERILEVDGLAAGYSGVPAVHDVSLHVDAGEVVALLGPNGAGKTTTLLTVSGIVHPLAGSIRFAGEDVAGHAPHRVARRGLVHVPEDRALFFGMTVRETIRLSSRPGGYDPYELFPELEPLAGRRAGLLSGGEQQMLAVGRAMAAAPRVLMVDEMSLGLAPILVSRLMPRLQEFARTRGVGVLLVEQHIGLALDFADRAYVLARGRVAASGTPEKVARSDAVESSYLGGHLS